MCTENLDKKWKKFRRKKVNWKKRKNVSRVAYNTNLSYDGAMLMSCFQ